MSKGNMEIRKSTREDIKQIMAIFTTAKECSFCAESNQRSLD